MNARAYRLGVIMVLSCSAVTVALRAFAEAAFLSAYGPAQMPWLLIANAVGFATATLGYDALTRRARPQVVDIVLLSGLAVAAVAAPGLLRAGMPPILLVIVLTAVSQVGGLALWNRVAASVAGRDARRMLPRAGAAVTTGGALAGLSAGAVIPRIGLAAIPYGAAAVAACVVALCIAQQRALSTGGAPGAVVPATPARGSATAQRRLLVALIAVAALEGIVATVVDLQFISALKSRYTGTDLAAALALFYGATNVVLLALQATAAPHLLLTRSMTFMAAIHPLLVIAGYAWFAVTPSFVAIAGTRTCDQVLRLATSRPAQELALSMVPPAPRARWKVLLRGAMWPGGAAIAALVLLLLGPAALAHPVRLAGAAIAVALAAAALARVAARRFQAALAAPLGIATAEHADPRRIDLETLERWTLATGDANPRHAAVARAALARARIAPTDLADHLRHDEPAVRAALYEQLARAPAPELRGELRAAIGIEDDDDALVRGIHALAILGDRAGIERGRERAGLSRAVDDAVAAAELLLADRAATHGAAVEDDTLATLVEHSATLAIAFVRTRRPPADVVERVVAGATSNAKATATSRANAMAVAAAIATPPLAAMLGRALASGDPAALAALASLDDAGARALAVQLAAMEPVARIVAARAAASTPSGVHLISALLDDGDPEVGYAALRSAVALARGGTLLAAAVVDAAHARVLGALVAHLDARDGLVARRDAGDARGARDALDAARLELDIATRRCVARLLWVSAVEAAAAGRDPALLAATARHLVGGGEAERKRALDITQELQARPDAIAAIERWLRAPVASQAAMVHAAIAAHDPWLADRLTRTTPTGDDTVHAALRRPALFATVAGAALAGVAARVHTRDVAGVLFMAGDPGDSMFVVASGALVARRRGEADRRIEAGGVVGELAVLTHAPRAATIEAAEPGTRVLVIDRAAFADLARRAPELVLGLSATLAGWLAPSRPDAL